MYFPTLINLASPFPLLGMLVVFFIFIQILIIEYSVSKIRVHILNVGSMISLTLKAPITTKIVCFSRLLKCLRSLCGKQCGPRSDCSYRSSLFWVHAVCFYTHFVSKVRQLFAADDFSRRHFQMHFFHGALRVNIIKMPPTFH